MELEPTPTAMTPTPPGGKYIHAECVKRGVSVFGAFILLIVVGCVVHAFVPGPGLLLLAIAPCFILIHFFHDRYRSSSDRKQAHITFCESVLLMIPLIFLLGPVDSAIKSNLTIEEKAVCPIPISVGFYEMHFLSYFAECKLPVGERHLHGLPICSPDEYNVAKTLGEDGGVPLHILANIRNVVRKEYHPAAHTLGTCDLQKLEDVEGTLKLDYKHPSGKTSHPRSAKALAGACEDLFPGLCSSQAAMNVTVKLKMRVETATLEVTHWGHVKTYMYAFVEAFFRAAFLEESLKYIAVRRILFKDRVADTGALVVYGLAAAAGFATAENVQYTLSYGLQVAFTRMMLSIPLHCCTGLMIGMSLGRRKFLGERHRMLRALMAPVVAHGLYDFFLMVPASCPINGSIRLLFSVATLIGASAYCRWLWQGLEKVCVADVHALMLAGKVSPSSWGCCEGDCCQPIVEHDDPMLADAATRNTFQKLARGPSFNLFPKAPQCQTRVANCYQCRNEIRVLIFFPSRCPHCEAPHLSALDAVRAVEA